MAGTLWRRERMDYELDGHKFIVSDRFTNRDITALVAIDFGSRLADIQIDPGSDSPGFGSFDLLARDGLKTCKRQSVRHTQVVAPRSVQLRQGIDTQSSASVSDSTVHAAAFLRHTIPEEVRAVSDARPVHEPLQTLPRLHEAACRDRRASPGCGPRWLTSRPAPSSLQTGGGDISARTKFCLRSPCMIEGATFCSASFRRHN